MGWVISVILPLAVVGIARTILACDGWGGSYSVVISIVVFDYRGNHIGLAKTVSGYIVFNFIQ